MKVAKEQPLFELISQEDIIDSYQGLNEKVKLQLADFYNHFLGLRMIAYGKDWQREFIFQQIQDSIYRHEAPFKTFFYRDHLDEIIKESLEKQDGEFAQIDLEHISKLNKMLEYTNQLANSKRLTRGVAKDIYDALIPYLYGRPSSKKNQKE